MSCIIAVLAPARPRQTANELRVFASSSLTNSTSRSSSKRERQSLARGRTQNQSVDGPARVVPQQSPQRPLIEHAVAKRRHQRQPKTLQSVSKVVHCPSPCGVKTAGNRTRKNPVATAGFRIGLKRKTLLRAPI